MDITNIPAPHRNVQKRSRTEASLEKVSLACSRAGLASLVEDLKVQLIPLDLLVSVRDTHRCHLSEEAQGAL